MRSRRRRCRCSTWRRAISELGEALLPLINPVVGAKYGLQIASFIVENVSVPPEVEAAIDKRSSMAAVGNLNDFVKYQMAKGMEQPGGGGAAGTASQLAVGFAIAQQLMQQSGVVAPATAAAGAVGRPAQRVRPQPHRRWRCCQTCSRPRRRRRRSAFPRKT